MMIFHWVDCWSHKNFHACQCVVILFRKPGIIRVSVKLIWEYYLIGYEKSSKTFWIEYQPPILFSSAICHRRHVSKTLTSMILIRFIWCQQSQILIVKKGSRNSTMCMPFIMKYQSTWSSLYNKFSVFFFLYNWVLNQYLSINSKWQWWKIYLSKNYHRQNVYLRQLKCTFQHRTLHLSHLISSFVTKARNIVRKMLTSKHFVCGVEKQQK